MILSVCKRGDKIIMPRNVHRSAINALVLCGAVPVYVNPGVDPQLGIALGMSLADVERAIEANPDAKAVLVTNPTYYGVCSDLRSIVKLAHAHGMRVLADEAHGTHFSFSDALPVSAMAAGALTSIQGGSAVQIGHAVAMALKNLLGLVCDPVAGLVEVPCVKRNVVGAVNAVSCADMAMAGIESRIPVDEVIDCMGEVGRRIPVELRETALGGLAATPTGKAVKERMEQA